MKIIADKHIPYLQGVAEYYGEVIYLAANEFTPQNIKDADVLIVRSIEQINEPLLAGTSVRLVCSATIGLDHIDTDYCDAHGIAWHNSPGCNAGAVKQYIPAALINMSRKLNFDLKDKTIGIVGVGNVGKQVASACQSLGMRVLLNDPPRADIEGAGQFVDLELIKQEADIITFHTPLTKVGKYKTYHLADADFFNTLGQKPIIMNAARGGVIDTSAIKNAINKKNIQGAVIDCWEDEPTLDLEYLSMTDISTAHIAGYSSDGKANAARMVLSAIADYSDKSKEPIDAIKEEEAEYPVIDLNLFDTSVNRVHEAILTTYNPLVDRKLLLAMPDQFKDLRNNYNYRREFVAYTVTNASQDEAIVLSALGFNLK